MRLLHRYYLYRADKGGIGVLNVIALIKECKVLKQGPALAFRS